MAEKTDVADVPPDSLVKPCKIGGGRSSHVTAVLSDVEAPKYLHAHQCYPCVDAQANDEQRHTMPLLAAAFAKGQSQTCGARAV